MHRASRMKKELEMLEKDPPHAISCWPVEDSLEQLCAQVQGPKDSPYEEGTFELEVGIPQRYPFEPPKVKFTTPIYHPNIDTEGRICLDILKMQPKGAWTPSLNISTMLTSIQLLMAEPNPDDALMADIASEFKQNKSLFIQKARDQTRKVLRDKEDKANSKPGDSEESSSSSSSAHSLQAPTASEAEVNQEKEAEGKPKLSKLLSLKRPAPQDAEQQKLKAGESSSSSSGSGTQKLRLS